MQRLKANDYFYFSVDYFRTLIKDCEGSSLFIIRNKSNQPIAASILLHYGDIGHHHLTGYAPETELLRPNDYMIYSLINWGKSNQLQYLHLGGGALSICKFKAKFSNERIPYYVGYRVHIQEAYQLLCDIWRKENNLSQLAEYFPLYRLK
jgi:CelD/BcsL family acetyltransferase involved in cellulose biosynthesis